jgi:hypothetical protein
MVMQKISDGNWDYASWLTDELHRKGVALMGRHIDHGNHRNL